MRKFNTAVRRVVAMMTTVAFTFSAIPANALNIANLPLFVSQNLPPNLVIVLDDSGSMSWTYAPDALGNEYKTEANRFSPRRLFSSAYNPLYFNPDKLPDGTERYKVPTDDANNPVSAPVISKVYRNGFDVSRGSLDLSGKNFRPMSDYSPSSTNQGFVSHPNDLTTIVGAGATNSTVNGYAYYYTPIAGCTPVTADACFSLRLVKDQTPAIQQSFANWYSFYRTRNLTVVSGAWIAAKGIPTTTRVAWLSLNTCDTFGATACSGWGAPASGLDNRIREFDTTHRADFFKWISRLPANNSTPLQQAMERVGNYYKRAQGVIDSPYAESPQVKAGTEYACRQNYAMLMTDGIWNSYQTTVGEKDSVSTSLPDGKSYSPMSPYKDSAANTLSDLTFMYWATDLAPWLGNQVKTYEIEKGANDAATYWNPKNDPATWQHLVTFTVGLGLTKTLEKTGLAWDGTADKPTYAGDYPNLVSGAKAWPNAALNASPQNAADLWHAAINSRGQFFSAETSADIVDAFGQVINRVKAEEGTGSAAAASSSSYRAGSALYQGSYVGSDWSGDLKKIAVNADGAIGATKWSAAEKLKTPDFANRKIFTRNTTSGAAIEFKWASLSSGQQTRLSHGTDAAGGQARLDWIRGDASGEDDVKLRKRATTKLGDIVGSSPIRIATPNAPIADPSYYDFRVANVEGNGGARPPVVYVGANDGMLHAFDDATGSELFAYIPSPVLDTADTTAHLAQLTLPSYQHRFYVDGTPTALDLQVDGNWTTVLVGGLGAGGRGLYALDVTNPSSFSTANVMWEFTPSNGDGDMGYFFGKPVAAKMKNGKWAVVFGNGYNSTSGKAVLYVAFVADGKNGWNSSSLKRIEVDAGPDNGLSSPTVVDVDVDGYADAIYAGDIKGNMWKVDVSASDPASWGKALGGPLYSAKDASLLAQPITVAPEVVKHPLGGVMVLFGTGMAIQDSDVNGTFQTQTFYGIWDTPERNIGVGGRSDLLRHIFSGNAMGDDGNTYRTIDTATPDWWASNNTSGDLGWYVDFPDVGERLTNNPRVRSGQVVFVSGGPSNDRCAAGGYSWLNIIDAVSGSRLTTPPFDETGDRKFDKDDYVNGTSTASQKLDVGYGSGGTAQEQGKDKDPSLPPGTCATSFFVQGSKDRSIQRVNIACRGTTGRLNWRDIMR